MNAKRPRKTVVAITYEQMFRPQHGSKLGKPSSPNPSNRIKL
jgi:hypothetical protein